MENKKGKEEKKERKTKITNLIFPSFNIFYQFANICIYITISSLIKSNWNNKSNPTYHCTMQWGNKKLFNFVSRTNILSLVLGMHVNKG